MPCCSVLALRTHNPEATEAAMDLSVYVRVVNLMDEVIVSIVFIIAVRAKRMRPLVQARSKLACSSVLP